MNRRQFFDLMREINTKSPLYAQRNRLCSPLMIISFKHYLEDMLSWEGHLLGEGYSEEIFLYKMWDYTRKDSFLGVESNFRYYINRISRERIDKDVAPFRQCIIDSFIDECLGTKIYRKF